ncbi:MAG TPA: protoporphyrinogen oxidase [bacterium]|nr:protoporphyrinogen oxidase [bacterium]
MSPLHVTIVGAGVSGLSAGHRLLELSKEKQIPVELSVLDAGPKAGGTLSTVEKNGFLMEEGPDCFITEKPAGLELCKKLGLEDQIIKTNPNIKQSYILKGGSLHPIPEGFYMLAPSRLMPLMTTPLLSPLGKLRAAFEPFVKVRQDPQDESIGAFVRRRLGREVLDNLAQPLIGGVYNADPEDLSVAACVPRFKEMELKYRSLLKALAARRLNSQAQVSGARYSLFVSFKKGVQILGDALASKIPAQSLSLNNPVSGLKPTSQGIWEITANNKTHQADAVILAIQPNKMRSLLVPLDGEWDKLLGAIPAHDSATLNLGFRREDVGHPLNGFGFVVPAREKKLLVGCTFASQKFEGRAPEGSVLLRAFLGPEAAGHIKTEGEKAVAEKVLAELKPILGLRGEPVVTHLATYNASMSYFRPGHLSQVTRLENKAAETTGLYLAGNGLKGVGIPDCIAAGQDAAEKAFQSLTLDKQE